MRDTPIYTARTQIFSILDTSASTTLTDICTERISKAYVD